MSPRRRSLFTAIVVVGALLVAFILLGRPLQAWFSGNPTGGHEGTGVATSVGPFSVHATLDPDPPRQAGQALILEVRDASGGEVGDASVDVVYDMPAMGAMPEMKGGTTISNEGHGRYRAEFDLPMLGSWTLRVSIRSPSGQGSQDFSMTVGSAGLSTAGVGGVASADGGTSEQGIVTIEEARRQLIGVRTAPVVQAPMRRVFRAVGRIAYDESSLADVSLKVRGWITKLYVNQTGQHVARGQTLFTLYSPELYNAEQDFLLASRGATGLPDSGAAGTFGPAARERLRLLGLDDSQIDAIASRGSASQSLAFTSPASGFVIEKNVVEGAAIDAGTRLYRIAALGKVWVEADIYESDFANVRVGQKATVTLDYLPGRTYEAKLAYVYPYLDEKTRTGRVRIELANKGLDLRPGMFANVELAADLGQRVQVPVSAVVYTGPRRIVFVDLGQGRFKPQEIEVGAESGGMYEVLSGLSAGDVVATSGVFLIAAEARIRTAATYWEPQQPSGDAGMTMTTPSASTGTTTAPSSMGMPTKPPVARPSVSAPPASSAPPPAASVYTCPMHPEVQSPEPGSCPKCGMKLVPKAMP